jgi:hypothetical protein
MTAISVTPRPLDTITRITPNRNAEFNGRNL